SRGDRRRAGPGRGGRTGGGDRRRGGDPGRPPHRVPDPRRDRRRRAAGAGSAPVAPARGGTVTLHSLIGHEDARRAVAASFAAGRLPAALLLTGPRGVGKQRFALWIAQLVVCERVGVVAEPAGAVAGAAGEGATGTPGADTTETP